MSNLGERIAYYRKNNNLTQEQLAEKCEVTPQAVSKWENDLTAPDLSLIPLLAKLFGISCDELLGVRKAETSTVPAELVDLNKTLLKVNIVSEDGDVVKVNLPLSIAEAVLKSGIIKPNGEGSPLPDLLQNIDLAQIITLVKMGAVGKLVEIKSHDGNVVEVWVE